MKLAIATSLTLGNAVCGLLGVALLITAGQDAFVPACLLTFAAWAFDMVDGIVARRLGVDGPFGAVLDSMCDVVSFGVLPAAILIAQPHSRPEVALAIASGAIYMSASILRLARYTLKASDVSESVSRFWFEGLSSPAAAMCFSAAALIVSSLAMQIALVIVLAALMVSRLPYPDLVNFYLARRLPFWSLAAPLVLLALDWKAGLAAVLGFYVILGPAIAVQRKISPWP